MLAYYFLLLSETPLTLAELDTAIEHWLQKKWQCLVNFEIDDALNKLLALELVSESDGKLSVVSIQDGIKVLDARWDDYFVAD